MKRREHKSFRRHHLDRMTNKSMAISHYSYLFMYPYHYNQYSSKNNINIQYINTSPSWFPGSSKLCSSTSASWRPLCRGGRAMFQVLGAHVFEQKASTIGSHRYWVGGHRYYIGWRPSLLGWRPSLLGWRPSLLGWRPSLLGWRQSLLGGRPLL